jgi:F0F1-type ATP synthase membrane subunit b/b'
MKDIGVAFGFFVLVVLLYYLLKDPILPSLHDEL